MKILKASRYQCDEPKVDERAGVREVSRQVTIDQSWLASDRLE